MVSGEASGDLHGSELIKELKKRLPDISIKGMGGPKMLRAGLDGTDSTDIAVMGAVEVVKKLPAIKRAYNDLKQRLSSEKFDCVVLIDYPGFNLRFAKLAKNSGVPVIYYVSPKIWAWCGKRIDTIKENVDKMLVIFPFETEIYKKAGVDAEYVGNPVTDAAVCELTKNEARNKLAIPADAVVIAALPGSRKEEVKRLLKPMADGLEILNKKLGKTNLIAALPVADGITEELLMPARSCAVPFKFIKGSAYEVLKAADAAMVASGTATLETALIGTPMVIVYKLSPLTYAAGKMLVKIKHVGLPNIIAGREVVRELLQRNATP